MGAPFTVADLRPEHLTKYVTAADGAVFPRLAQVTLHLNPAGAPEVVVSEGRGGRWWSYTPDTRCLVTEGEPSDEELRELFDA